MSLKKANLRSYGVLSPKKDDRKRRVGNNNSESQENEGESHKKKKKKSTEKETFNHQIDETLQSSINKLVQVCVSRMSSIEFITIFVFTVLIILLESLFFIYFFFQTQIQYSVSSESSDAENLEEEQSSTDNAELLKQIKFLKKEVESWKKKYEKVEADMEENSRG